MFQSKIFNLQTGGMTCLIDGVLYTIDKSHQNYKILLKAFNENDHKTFLDHKDISVFASKDSKGNATGITVQGGAVYYNGEKLHSVIADYIVAMRKDGFDVDYMVKFLERLMQNPSKKSVDQLFTFLQNKNLPITEDGCFLAYKSVVKSNASFVDKNSRQVNVGDLVDKYSQSLRNNVGDVLEMPRNKVDDDNNRQCSYGYHVGGLAYSGPQGWYHSSDGVVLVVKVDPKDAVSVPTDHNCQKLRVCKYEVVGLFKEQLPSSCVKREDDEYQLEGFDYENDYDWDDDEEYDDYE